MQASDRRRISIRLTEGEALELAVLRHAYERAERRPVTLRAALRAAIELGHASDWSAMDYRREPGKTTVRIEMIIADDESTRLDEIKASHEADPTLATAVLACARRYIAVSAERERS